MRFPVRSEKLSDLYARMEEMSVREEDIEETFIRCPGRGGQKVNKTSAGVQLRYRPDDLLVRWTRERSQGLNRFFARRLLVEKLEALRAGMAPGRDREAERIRKQKKRRRSRSRLRR